MRVVEPHPFDAGLAVNFARPRSNRTIPAPKLNPEELIWFRVGGELELHLFDSYEPAALSRHFWLRIDSGLEQLRRRHEDAGIQTHDTDEIVGGPRFFCRDPSGTGVELTEWRGA